MDGLSDKFIKKNTENTEGEDKWRKKNPEKFYSVLLKKSKSPV